jgi:hypothetical protein
MGQAKSGVCRIAGSKEVVIPAQAGIQYRYLINNRALSLFPKVTRNGCSNRYFGAKHNGGLNEEDGMKNKEDGNWNNKTSIGIITLFVFSIMLMTSINACGFLGIGNTASWKEEVLLHDGSKIIVKRWQKREGRHEIGQTPPIGEQSIKFTLPGTNKVITWKDEYSKEIGRSNFELLALHILNATPYIITTPRLCLSYNKWGRPNPPYVIFKYENNVWKRIELPELPAEFKNINLVINSKSHEEELVSQSLASAEMVKKLNSSLTQPELKTIIRTPMEGVGCERMVRIQGGWEGIDWFSSQPNYEACLKHCSQENVKKEDCPCDSLFKRGK